MNPMGENYGGLSTGRRASIREEACKWLNTVYFEGRKFLSGDASPELVVREAAEIVITRFFDYVIDKPPEIPSGRFGFQTAGVIDKAVRSITIAQNFPIPVRRFTIAHELGHLVLHRGMNYHRDRPLDGSQLGKISKHEREANLFAAEFRMPTNLLRTHVYECFGGPIDGSSADENLCFFVNASSGRRLTVQTFRGMSVLERAKLIASVATPQFESLQQRYMVSRTAMAIQLRDLRLVT